MIELPLIAIKQLSVCRVFLTNHKLHTGRIRIKKSPDTKYSVAKLSSIYLF